MTDNDQPQNDLPDDIIEGDTIPDTYHLPIGICPHDIEDLHEVFYDDETGTAEIECLRCGDRWFE